MAERNKEEAVTFEQVIDIAGRVAYRVLRRKDSYYDDLRQEAIIEGWQLLQRENPPGLGYFYVAMLNRARDVLSGHKRGIRSFGSERNPEDKEYSQKAGDETREHMALYRKEFWRTNKRYPTQVEWAKGVGISVSALREHIPRLHKFVNKADDFQETSVDFSANSEWQELVDHANFFDASTYDENFRVLEVLKKLDANPKQKTFLYYVAFEDYSIMEGMKAAGYNRNKLASTSRKQLQEGLIAAGLKRSEGDE